MPEGEDVHAVILRVRCKLDLESHLLQNSGDDFLEPAWMDFPEKFRLLLQMGEQRIFELADPNESVAGYNLKRELAHQPSEPKALDINVRVPHGGKLGFHDEAVGAHRIVLAVKNKKSQLHKLRAIYPDYELLPCPSRYPAGAEKLIIKKLERKMPPPGARPYQQGYLVQNVVSLRAVGRALLDGIPVVERPLTLAMPSQGFYKNIIAPVNILIWEVLEKFNLPYDRDKHIITSSGLMMGCEVSADDCIEKITTSLIILERDPLESEERDCIRCGACNSACPLGLHPFTLTEAVEKKQAELPEVQIQLKECFLCGACSAVCPSQIPLVQILMEGKRCLR